MVSGRQPHSPSYTHLRGVEKKAGSSWDTPRRPSVMNHPLGPNRPEAAMKTHFPFSVMNKAEIGKNTLAAWPRDYFLLGDKTVTHYIALWPLADPRKYLLN